MPHDINDGQLFKILIIEKKTKQIKKYKCFISACACNKVHMGYTINEKCQQILNIAVKHADIRHTCV